MNNIMKITTWALTLSFGFLFCACDSSSDFEKEEKAKFTLDLSGEVVLVNTNALVHDENNPSNFYSRIDSINIYGYCIIYYLPDSLKNFPLKIILSGKMRETESITGNIPVSLINNKDSLTYWGMLNAVSYLKEPNVWLSFKDSVMIPQSANGNTTKILKIFSSKGLGKGTFDVDDLKIEVVKNL